MNIKKEDLSIYFREDRYSKLILYKEGEGKASSSALNKSCLFFIRVRRDRKYWMFYICPEYITSDRNHVFFLERFSTSELLENLNRVINYSHIQRKIIKWNLED